MDELDQWIAHLSACKQLSEPDVKRLCDKVGFKYYGREGASIKRAYTTSRYSIVSDVAGVHQRESRCQLTSALKRLTAHQLVFCTCSPLYMLALACSV
jgi:hypothetical protein